jgi:hypothetical protein
LIHDLSLEMAHFFRCHRVGFGNHGNNIHLSKIGS